MKTDLSIMLRFSLIGGLILVSSCSFAPDYRAPDIAVPPIYEEVSGNWMPAMPADTLTKGNWWMEFNEPRLNDLENQVTDANQDLKVAVAQYDEARALASLARGDYFPTITGNSDYQREHTSAKVANARPDRSYNDFLLGANLSYEVDVWGRVRNAVAAGLDRAQASGADLANIDLSLHAELAGDYFQLRGDDAAQNVLDQTVGIYQKSLELVQNRYKGGISAEVDVDQAQLQLQNAQTQASDMRLHRAQLEHAIAVLTGHVPSAFHLDPLPLDNVNPPAVTAGVPSILLQRRPDIAAAERRVAAANAEIGVARAAFFPTFSLTAMLGLESANPGSWLTAPATFWSLGPSTAVTLIDGGKLEALSDQAHAQYDETVGEYRQTVLSAYQEVEDNLAAIHHLSDEMVTQAAATEAAQRTLKQENFLYKGGTAIYIDVATIENAALQANISLVDVKVRRLVATVQLFKSLGGGWDYKQAFSVSPDQMPAQALMAPTMPVQPTIVTVPSEAKPIDTMPVKPDSVVTPAVQTETVKPNVEPVAAASPPISNINSDKAPEPAQTADTPEPRRDIKLGWISVSPDYPDQPTLP
jgi:NodT family efflux transporter outer membrane factor (OMF) lipoprotein